MLFYMLDGDQCAEQPCKNGAMCSDSVGGFDCICKSGFSGINCETGMLLKPHFEKIKMSRIGLSTPLKC